MNLDNGMVKIHRIEYNYINRFSNFLMYRLWKDNTLSTTTYKIEMAKTAENRHQELLTKRNKDDEERKKRLELERRRYERTVYLYLIFQYKALYETNSVHSPLTPSEKEERRKQRSLSRELRRSQMSSRSSSQGIFVTQQPSDMLSVYF